MDFRLWPTSVRIARTLPGELIGEVNPEDYGFGVIREEPPDEAEAAIRCRRAGRADTGTAAGC